MRAGGSGSARETRKHCLFYTTRAGCRHGARCAFVHDPEFRPTQADLNAISASDKRVAMPSHAPLPPGPAAGLPRPQAHAQQQMQLMPPASLGASGREALPPQHALMQQHLTGAGGAGGGMPYMQAQAYAMPQPPQPPYAPQPQPQVSGMAAAAGQILAQQQAQWGAAGR